MRRARLGTVSICCHLALQALRSAPPSSITSIALVCFASFCVLGADLALTQLAELANRLAEGGGDYRAQIDITRCPRCVHTRDRSSPLQQRVTELRHASVELLASTGQSREWRLGNRTPREPDQRHAVPVHCAPSREVPAGVRWLSRSDRTAWSDHVGAPVVVVGADLAPWVRDIAVQTTLGAWTVVGHMPRRAHLAHDAVLNGALLVPNRAPFTRLCEAGAPTWQLAAADTTRLTTAIRDFTDELRTAMALRADVRAPWRIVRLDRFVALLQRLADRVRVWVLLIPLGITVLCAAGVFSVQTLQSEQRIGEFGVRRAVGASRGMLLGQLVTESAYIGVAGLCTCVALLCLSGLISADGIHLLRLVMLSLMVVLPLITLGVLIPGLSALRSVSIAQLEGRNE